MPPRRGSTAISATKPVFQDFVLPSLRLLLRRQPLTPSSPTSNNSANSPNGPEPTTTARRLSRAPDTFRCMCCSTDLGLASQIVSKAFTGPHGRAYLVAPSPAAQSLLNIRVGHHEKRRLLTGWHMIADIYCATCSLNLGWKYISTWEESQAYKIGSFCLETAQVVTHRSWEDYDVGDPEPFNEGGDADDHQRSGMHEIEFDSDDEDQCLDLFEGIWNAAEVARRHNGTTTRDMTLLD